MTKRNFMPIAVFDGRPISWYIGEQENTGTYLIFSSDSEGNISMRELPSSTTRSALYDFDFSRLDYVNMGKQPDFLKHWEETDSDEILSRADIIRQRVVDAGLDKPLSD